MAVITISRGSATGGLMLAEGLAKTLGYRLIRREDILQGTVRFGVEAAKLERFLFGPPTFSNGFRHDIQNYISFFQAALCETIQKDNAIYLGNVGHMLLRGIACVLSVRLIAPPEFRIRMLMEREQLAREQASALIDKIDAQRRAWTLFLYGVDCLDPALYDLTLNLECMDIGMAVDIAATAARHKRLAETDSCLQAFDNIMLASRTRAELAADPRLSPADIEVEADAAAATVFLEGKLAADLVQAAVDIARNIPGVEAVDTSRLVDKVESGV